MEPLPRTVGRFELLEVLGRGGAGTVYLACQTDLGRLVALKQLDNLRGDTELGKRFVREARMTAMFAHPNIVQIYEYFEHDGGVYISMELVPHGALRAYMTPRLDRARVGGVLKGLLAALSHALAERQIVHRDVKPENVLVARNGHVKLTDFGIARAIDATTLGSPLTTIGGIVGTLDYMAPEQATGGEIGPWTDCFSAGVIAYELLVGKLPRPPADNWQTPAQLVCAPIRPPLVVDPGLDPGLAAWLVRMLQKEPADRHRDAAQAWDELEQHLVRLLDEGWRRGSAIAVGALPPLPACSALPDVPVDPPPPWPLIKLAIALSLLAAALTAIAERLG